jgi:ABC-type antimicrobial peptide transport system permease subunit
MIVKQAGVICGVGVVVGIVAALGLTTLLRDYLYDINASDPATYAGLALLMFIVALAASYMPARRATGVRPMVALRQD